MTINKAVVCDGCHRPQDPNEPGWLTENEVALCPPCKRTIRTAEQESQSVELNFNVPVEA